MKTYQVSDLFYTKWTDLSPKVHALVYALQQQAVQQNLDPKTYGFTIIKILRLLRKNWRLVDKLNVEQAVDIYNDLSFLRAPWYHFPYVSSCRPEEKMARHTFDHFIYADNEFTSYIATHDEKYLRRLLVTLYSEAAFDKECVAEREAKLKTGDFNLHLVFFTYAQVREFVVQRCKTLLPKPKKQEDDIDQPVSSTGSMWLQLKHRLAETPAFQGYDNAGRANMYSALDYLEDLAKRQHANT